jgi:hypothetical protein
VFVVPSRGCWNANFVRAAHSGNLFAIGQDNGVGDFLVRRENTASENGL